MPRSSSSTILIALSGRRTCLFTSFFPTSPSNIRSSSSATDNHGCSSRSRRCGSGIESIRTIFNLAQLILILCLFLQPAVSQEWKERKSNSIRDRSSCVRQSALWSRDRRCLKKCLVDEDCRGRGRRCLCDGTCGMSCIRINKKCDPLEEIDNGWLDIHPPEATFNSTVKYYCQSGFTMTGQPSRVCHGDGSWSGQRPSCDSEGKCGSPPEVENASFETRAKYLLGTQLIYRCSEGYFVHGYFRALCAGEGRWIGPKMVCSPRKCGHPGDIPNGYRLGTLFLYSNNVTYSCTVGYKLVGDASRQCQADGQWSGQLPICRPISCPALFAPKHGFVQGKDLAFGAVVTFTCEVGYRLLGPPSRMCQHDGTWTGYDVQCPVVDCGNPGRIDNGYISGPLRTTYGSVVHFRCLGMTTFEGKSRELECTGDGTWSHPVPKCWSVCPIPSVDNGQMVIRGISTGLNHGETIEYTCDTGYSVGTVTPVCQNGTWSVLPNCVPAACKSRPPDVNNGMARFHSSMHGEKALYWCNEGYDLVGNEFITCEYGEWITEPPVCEKTICPHPGYIMNGRILILGVKGKFEYRHYVKHISHSTQIQFVCDKDFELVGATEATCVHNTWSPPITARCIQKRHPELPYDIIFRG